MKKTCAIIVTCLLATIETFGAQPSPFARKYSLGETIKYQMAGKNSSQSGTHSYTILSTGIVKKDQAGSFFENTGWSDLNYDGVKISLSNESLQFRQQVSLDQAYNMATHFADQSSLDKRLFAPSDDLMNFYVDLQLGAKLPMLQKSGDHFYVKYGVPTKYENGHAETCVDFDATLVNIDQQRKIAILRVKHVPPQTACVGLPAPWMQVSASGNLPNNVVQIIPTKEGTYEVTVGNETIDVELTVNLETGKIIEGKLTDSFILLERICKDPQGMECHSPANYQQLRNVTLKALQ